MSICIVTDSGADFTREELTAHDIRCVSMQVMFGTDSFEADSLPMDAFWQRMHAGENGTTSQPSPDAFYTAFKAALDAGCEIVYVGISSILSGTVQSAMIARSMLDEARIHIVDTLSGAGGQKLLALHACKLRGEGKLNAAQIAAELHALRSRVRVYASLDTLSNLARSGRISKAAANIGTLAQLKPLVRITPETEGAIEVCGKAIGRHRAIDALCKLIQKHSADPRFPVVALYSYCTDNCAAMLKRLCAGSFGAYQHQLSELGPTLCTHIGANAYGVAFIEAK